MEEEIINRPKWLLELENRKRKVRYKIFMPILYQNIFIKFEICLKIQILYK